MTRLQVRVESITFEHALPLLHGQRRVPQPEWTVEGESHPAAIPGLTSVLALRVQLSCNDGSIRGCLRAMRVEGTLATPGHVPDTNIDFGGARQIEVAIRVPVDTPHVEVGTIRWRWEVTAGVDCLPAGTSEHAIAFTLSSPQPPWGTTGSPGLTLPWWEVVHHACLAANGASDPEHAATLLAHQTFAAWRRSLYSWQGARHYVTDGSEEPAVFDCAAFVRLLETGRGPSLVDCSDLAAVLSTFANILGCCLQQVVIGGAMTLNPILLSGRDRWDSRFGEFGIHEFTVTGQREPEMRVWDGCLQVSSDEADERPGTRTPDPADVPANMTVGEYFDRLFFTDESTFEERFGRIRIRRLGPLPPVVSAPHRDSPLVIAGARLWSPPPDAIPSTCRVHALVFGEMSVDGWEALEPTSPRALKFPDSASDAVERSVWQATDEWSRLMSGAVYVCVDTSAAHVRTQSLLGELVQFEPVEPIVSPPVNGAPEYRFALDKGNVVVGTLLNVAYIIRRASRTDLSVQVRNMAERVRLRILASRLPLA
jgi:hypothetical protein